MKGPAAWLSSMLLTFDLATLAVSLPTASILAIGGLVDALETDPFGSHRPPKPLQQ